MMKHVRAPIRLLAWALASLGFVVLSTIAIVVTWVSLTTAFMTHDPRGLPIEPAWAGPVGLFGGLGIVGVLVGYVLGRATGLRALDGLLAGVLSGVGWCALWFVSQEWRGGYPVDRAQLLNAWPVLLTVTVVMALATEWGGRVASEWGHQPGGRHV